MFFPYGNGDDEDGLGSVSALSPTRSVRGMGQGQGLGQGQGQGANVNMGNNTGHHHRNPPELKPIIAASSGNGNTSPTSLSTPLQGQGLGPAAQGQGLGPVGVNSQPPQPTLPRIKSARKEK